VHLDHAGATGAILRHHETIEVYVHERGAPHMADPSKLLSSAARIFGSDMERLWGGSVPVPESNLRVVRDGERLQFGSRILEVAYTPGHAVHHVSYLDETTGTAFAGEAAGLRLWDTPFVYPPTPPPDIDVEAWQQSLRRLATWNAERLFIPHFGVATQVSDQLTACWERLLCDLATVRQLLQADATDESRADRFARAFADDLRAVLDDENAARLETASNPRLCFYGLARYCRRQERVV
jgi:glyoxylase-like metal-dependent hydrolase (beta-lactamase superfamily II)